MSTAACREADDAMIRALAASALSVAHLVVAAEPVRSAVLRAEFVRTHPCPATGATRGPCPGYQVDHREALICGGMDEMSNLQWLTVSDHKAKTRVEVKLCRTHSK